MSLKNNQNKGTSAGSTGSPVKKSTHYRVEDIILNDAHPAYISEDDLGTIFYTEVGFHQEITDSSNLPTAKPISSQNFIYPTIGEIVEITEGPSPDHYESLGGNVSFTEAYYSVALNIHSNTHNNALPTENKSKRKNPKRDKKEVIKDENKDFRLGNYIKDTVKPFKKLLPSEGDSIFEGRFGQRIHLTAAGPEGTNAVSNKVTDNPNDGNPNVGDKAMVLSLGNGSVENITEDAASVWMGENINVPTIE